MVIPLPAEEHSSHLTDLTESDVPKSTSIKVNCRVLAIRKCQRSRGSRKVSLERKFILDNKTLSILIQLTEEMLRTGSEDYLNAKFQNDTCNCLLLLVIV
jgi:hypothetical protein